MSGYIAPSATAAQAEADRRRGPNMRLKVGRTYDLRLLPAFKTVDGQGIWFSVRRKHWTIPVPGTTESRTFVCPKELDPAQPCYICDVADKLKPTLPQLAKSFSPNLSYMFNVIDTSAISFGPQQLEDGATLFNLLLGIVDTLPTVADPELGQVIIVNRLPASPWRTAIPGKVLPFSEMGLDISVAFVENLPNLDDAWTVIDYAEQQSLFSAIEANPHAIEAAQAAQIPAAVVPGAVAGAPGGPPLAVVTPQVPVGVTPQVPAVVTPQAAPPETPPPITPETVPEAGADVETLQAQMERAAEAGS